MRRRTGECRVSAQLRLGEWTVNLSSAEDYPCQDIEEEHLPVGGLYLPLKIVRTKRWNVTEEVRSVNEGQARLKAEAQALEEARSKLPADAQESAFWAECIRNGDELTVRVVVEARMNIAVDPSE